jgi:hypothetical protein
VSSDVQECQQSPVKLQNRLINNGVTTLRVRIESQQCSTLCFRFCVEAASRVDVDLSEQNTKSVTVKPPFSEFLAAPPAPHLITDEKTTEKPRSISPR